MFCCDYVYFGTLPRIAPQLAFFIRISIAPFSKKISDQIFRYRWLHLMWGILAVCHGVFIFLLLSQAWPPHGMELRKQREIVAKRIQDAGGWTAITNGCASLVETNDFFVWYRGQPAPLPPALAKLKPIEIRCEGPIRQNEGPPTTKVVRMKIFGGHATGGHSTPYYGFEVVCGPVLPDYSPSKSRAASGNSHYQFRKLSEAIYEIY